MRIANIERLSRDWRAGSRHGMKHGSETFFIEGEGLLTTQVGGRTGDEGDPLSESDNPKAGKARALAADTAPSLPLLQSGAQGNPLNATPSPRSCARAMVVGGGGDGKIPAGYTYLGQFVDHDLTMDRHRRRRSARTFPRRRAAGPLSAARPRLALRQRPRQPRVREVLRGRRDAPEDRYDDPGRGREGQAAP